MDYLEDQPEAVRFVVASLDPGNGCKWLNLSGVAEISQREYCNFFDSAEFK